MTPIDLEPPTRFSQLIGLLNRWRVHLQAVAASQPINQHLMVWVILMAGAFLRWSALGAMSQMLNYDEAYYGLDALSLLQHPQLTPFFPANSGRESAWMYILAPFIAVFGTTPLALRLAVGFVGVLTLVACYALAYEIMGVRGALWTMGALAVFYWPVHLQHLALRANLLPLVGTLTCAALVRAYRRNEFVLWAATGVGLGVLTYTYFSARLWIAYLGFLLGWWMLRNPSRRWGSALALALAVVLSVPLALYTYSYPELALGRLQTAGVFSLSEIGTNVLRWLGAWFSLGEQYPLLNLPDRPILDLPTALLFVPGLLALPLLVKDKWHAGWVAGLALVSVAPSILSAEAPHYLRAIGLVIPCALVLGAGAIAWELGVQRFVSRRGAALFPAALLILAGFNTYHDFHDVWLTAPSTATVMEESFQPAFEILPALLAPDEALFFSPLFPRNPTVLFRGSQVTRQNFGTFNGNACMLMSASSALYVSGTHDEPGFEQNLARWANVTPLYREQHASEPLPRFSVFRAMPYPVVLSGLRAAPRAVFGESLALRELGRMPDRLPAGDVLTVPLGFTPLHEFVRPVYSMFIHLYGERPPEQGGPIWAQGDRQLCDLYSEDFKWTAGLTFAQEFTLALPRDLPPGQYQIAVGIYESAAGTRLPVTSPSTGSSDYVVLRSVEVQAAPP